MTPTRLTPYIDLPLTDAQRAYNESHPYRVSVYGGARTQYADYATARKAAGKHNKKGWFAVWSGSSWIHD